MAEKQRTLKRALTLKGKGLHTGLDVELTIKPAPENHGYVFKRTDLENQPTIRAIVENVIDTSRSTVLAEKNIRVGTVEHLLSALYGLQIDNAIIEVNAPETPILDGSAKIYTNAITEAGIVEQELDKDYFVVTEKITYTDPDNNVDLVAIPDDNFNVYVMIDYNSSVLGNQFATLSSLDYYKEQISESKTFVFLRELEPLLKHNLIKGGDLNNAIVIVEREVTQDELDRLADLFQQPRVKVKKQGVLNNIELKFNNEPARHKLLDIIGDLSLVGVPVKGKIYASRPGHHSNVEFAKKIRREYKKQRSKNAVPAFNYTTPPVYDINDLKKLLPHRYPFLLVDKILDVNEKEVVGLKNVTLNEPFFIGHFPEEPVMPGVLIVESMAQVSGILVLHTKEDPENYSTYLLRIDKVKFRRKVVPGDTLILKCKLTTPIRRGMANVAAIAFVGSQIVAEGEFMAQIIKNK